jgi:hypothetical protein
MGRFSQRHKHPGDAYVQVKRSEVALKNAWDSANQKSIRCNDPADWIRWIDTWVGKAKADMDADGLPVKIRYYLPSSSQVPAVLKDHVTRLSEKLDIAFVYADDLSDWY